MMLHIGDSKVVSQKDIVIILPGSDADAWKSCILLTDGQVLYSSIASTTLKKRLDGGLFPSGEGF